MQYTRYNVQYKYPGIQYTRYKIQDTRHKIQDTRQKIQDTRYTTQYVYKIQVKTKTRVIPVLVRYQIYTGNPKMQATKDSRHKYYTYVSGTDIIIG